MSVVAAVQLNAGDDVQQNLDLTGELIIRAGAHGAALVVLPECFALMAKDHTQRLQHTESIAEPGPIQKFLSELALEFNIWILAAGVFVHGREAGMVRNSLLLYNDQGACVCRYDKINLFNVNLPDGESYSESRYTEPGTDIVVHESPVGPCGMSICYDIRFPQLYQELALRGATWFVVPSAFAYTTGKDHWEVLLRARAIENHAYVVAPAQWGVHPGDRRTFGNSMIVDPWGEVVARQVDNDGYLLAEIDSNKVNSIRARFDD